MRKTSGWINTLFALVFIVAPAFVLYYLFLPDWNATKRQLWLYYVISLAFVVYVFGLTFIFIKLETVGYDAFNFNLPIALVLMVIFISFDWSNILRILVTIVAICSAFPAIIFSNYLYHLKTRKSKQRKADIDN